MTTTVAVAKMMELLLSVALRQSLENKVSRWTNEKRNRVRFFQRIILWQIPIMPENLNAVAYVKK